MSLKPWNEGSITFMDGFLQGSTYTMAWRLGGAIMNRNSREVKLFGPTKRVRKSLALLILYAS
jgi:hypothetical protein